MKAASRYLGILLAVCLIFSFISCGNTADNSTDNTTLPNDNIIENKAEVISLDKEFVSHYDRQEGYPEMLVRSEYSNITVEENFAELYPVIARALSENSVMRSNTMESEREHFTAIAKESYETDSDSFTTMISELDTVVRRSDSIAVSIIEDYSTDGLHAIAGFNFDTQSGTLLNLSDVVTDVSQVPYIIEKAVMNRIGEEEPFGENAVSNYFKSHSAENLSWTLEYNGISFWFKAGDIAPTNFGIQSVTIAFNKYPELFSKKYITSPDAYIVGIPSATTYTFNNSGKAEELIITVDCDKASGLYEGFTIQTSSSDYEVSCQACNIHSYYVKAADGNSYLYVFADDSKEEDRQMKLLIFNLKNGKIEKISELNMGLLYRGDNVFALPTNPDKLLLCDYEGRYPSLEFRVGNGGLPEMSSSQE